MTRLYGERDLPPDAWDDPTPIYRPNWRDRRDMAARRAREAAGSDAGADGASEAEEREAE